MALFDAHIVHLGNDTTFQYDVTKDGNRFLVNTVAGGSGAAPSQTLTVVVNWNAEGKK